MSQAFFALGSHNPDVLACIANLSNDEVITPPEFANQMLDTLEKAWEASNSGENIWSNKEVTFLDPATKSGIFLREIVKRLNSGLTKEIPDLTERINHILTKQVFGLGITELTSLLARRSVYCSKNAKGIHSIARTFETSDGNIKFEKTDHFWNGAKCKFCGASKQEYDRGYSLESHAYIFTHTDNIRDTISKLWEKNMRFDVIVGNPPYQLSTEGSGGQARPIYHQFIRQAINLDPRFIVMVTPSRWFSGGMGLDSYRNEMLGDKRLREIVDFMRDKDAFPTVNVTGGVNYFVWDKSYNDKCKITTVLPGGNFGSPQERDLNEFDIFIRHNESIEILRKVLSFNFKSFSARVSSVDPFKLSTTFHGANQATVRRKIRLYGSGSESFIAPDEVNSNVEWIKKWKVLIPRATDGNENYPLPIWNQVGPIVVEPGTACTFTYLVASLADSERNAKYIANYMKTKFFRFMVFIRKNTQDNKSESFRFVPDIPMDRKWTDQELYKYFKLNQTDIDFINLMIRDMKFSDD
jgi:site-specific DNA-methyltransferase (adenine-specific)